MSGRAITPSVLARIEQWYLDHLQNRIIAVQSSHHAATGAYIQGLSSHSTRVRPGQSTAGDVIPDNLTARPSDRSVGLDDLMSAALRLMPWPISIEVHYYGGPRKTRDFPDGQGYFVRLVAEDDNGDLHERLINYGPQEAFDSGDWRPVSR